MTKEMNTDLVVIGGGAAGLMCAITSYEKGVKDIIVLDKVAKIGGGGQLAFGIGGIGSPAQKRLGIEWDIDKEFLNYINWCHWKSDARVVRAYLENSHKFFYWAEDHGLVYQTVLSTRPADEGEYRTCHIQPSTGGLTAGKGTIEKIVEVINEYRIPCYTKAHTKEILTENDRVSGVVAVINDEETIIHCKSVMVATGNLGGNKERVKKLWPNYRGEDIDYAGITTLKGEGLDLVAGAGGRIQDTVDFSAVGPAYTSNKQVAYEMGFALKWPQTLWVNKYGERFMDESLCSRMHTLGTNPLNLQQDKLCYSLCDSEMLKSIYDGTKFNHEHPTLKDLPEGDTSCGNMGNFFRLMPETFENEVKAGRVVCADTWEDLAAKLNMDPATLRETVDRYNADCDAGRDSEMCKEAKYLQSMRRGPFYAIPGGQVYDLSIGGIVINHKAQVLSEKELRPIPGLYAGGDNAWNGWVVDSLVDYWMPFSNALTFGIIAGENISKELNK